MLGERQEWSPTVNNFRKASFSTGGHSSNSRVHGSSGSRRNVHGLIPSAREYPSIEVTNRCAYTLAGPFWTTRIPLSVLESDSVFHHEVTLNSPALSTEPAGFQRFRTVLSPQPVGRLLRWEWAMWRDETIGAGRWQSQGN
jgi:hypothetical protein